MLKKSTIILSIFAILLFTANCIGVKAVDPGSETTQVTPRFSNSVPMSKLGTLGTSEIDSLNNGSEVKMPSSPILDICPSCCLTCDYEAAPVVRPLKRFEDDNACIDNVEEQFSNLPTSGHRLEAYASIDFIHKDRYTEKIENTMGLQNHIQGLVRLRQPGFFAVSGGDPPMEAVLQAIKDEVGNAAGDFVGNLVAGIGSFLFKEIFKTKNRSTADVWIVQYKSKMDQGTGKFGSSNLDFGPWNYPHPWDTIIVPLEVEKGKYWHPGGIARLGDIISVPLQSYLISDKPSPADKTVFLYVTDPLNPLKISMEVPLGGGNTSMMKLPSGRYLIQISGTWVLSKTTNFADGFDTSVTFNGAPGGSNVNIVKQCDGQIYTIGAHGPGGIPSKKGVSGNIAKLTKLNFDGTGLLNTDPTQVQLLKAPTKAIVAQKEFNCFEGGNKNCNFDAAASPYVDPGTKTLGYYGIYHFRTSDEKIRMREFMP